ncbi:hypothetical protein A3709_18295 [Halioglobus sp. HI00S01]|uniref:hypothetical protein n=1 Tax=Halioglobus sp. HI00S01 TaxID=1822214 RepID=UPI0007C2643A|nr:hypothetical protein [Halioglobus sp. HI00S01]KZX58570.1 hypothetical protein A3709_18295 [Halioglobus sp. HI00S01]
MYPAPITAVLLRALLLAPLASGMSLVATASPEAVSATAEPVSGEPVLRVSRASGENFRAAIAALESAGGAYASELPEQLLSLGLTLQQQGDHADAVEVFRRGVHLNRINNGLYSGAQVALLQQEIISLMAMGDYAKADERQHYMYRVQMRSMDKGLDRSQAFIQQAQWQYNAYQLELGDVPYLRIMSMWDLYRLALNDIIKVQGQQSAALLEPLEGMLLAQYLISGTQTGSNSQSQDLNIKQQYASNRFYRYQRESYKRGRAVIQAIYDLQLSLYGEDSPQVTKTQVMMGDWMLWNGEKEAAWQTYQEVTAELVAQGADQANIEAAFAEPVALPNYEGVHPLPPTVPAGESAVELAFTVTADGKVRNLERVDSNELNNARANKLMRKLRKTRFRPQLAMGEPIDTQRVLRSYDIQ